MERVAGLTIALLGTPRVEVNGAPLVVDTRKAVALLAYLAVEGQTFTRDTLAGLLWSDHPRAAASGALRRTLSSLRKALGGRWLAADRATVGLERDDVTLDIADFRSLLDECGRHGHPSAESCERCRAPLSAAAEMYRGDFMQGFSLRDAPEFEDWQLYQAEGLRHLLSSALDRLSSSLSSEHLSEGIGHARRWLALDPLHEPAHRRLMHLYGIAGQRSAALRQYRDCVMVLERELGVAPLAETTELYGAIKEDRVLPPAAAAAAPPPDVPVAAVAPTLVGRSGEWRRLQEAHRAAARRGRIALLQGEAGIGKTRLAEAFLAHVRERGAPVLAARSYEDESALAYAPVAEALRSALEVFPQRIAEVPEEARREAARLVPAIPARPAEPASPQAPGAQQRFLRGVAETFLTVLGGPPAGVLFFDDLHWADDASIGIVSYMVRRLRTAPLLLLLAWRPEDMPAANHLVSAVEGAERSGDVERLVLDRLNEEDVIEMVRSAAGSRVESPASVGATLHRETEGVPLFVVEYLAGVKAVPVAPGADMPRGMRQLFRSRLAPLSELGRQVIAAASVVGRSFGFDIVREASGRSDEEMVSALEELCARGLVIELADPARSSTGAEYDFSHEKMRAFVYEDTGLARRRLLHRRVAEFLVRRRARRDGGWAALIARHYQLGGLDERAAEYFVLAGDRARAVYANVEALSHYRAALGLGHPDAGDLHEKIGDLHTLTGEYGEAVASLERATALCEPGRMPLIEHKLGVIHHRRGEWHLAEGHFRAALENVAPTGEAFRARVCADWSLAVHHGGSPDRAAELAEGALRLAEAAGSAEALARSHNVLGILAGRRGDPAAARAHLERSLALASAEGEPAARVAALNNLALVCRSAGELEEAIELTRGGLEVCASQGDRHREAALHNNLADLLMETGRSEQAMEHLKIAVKIFAEVGDPGEMTPGIWKLVEW